MIQISQIATLREERGWSQQELADAAGVSVSLIQKVEQGIHTNLTINNLTKIDAALIKRPAAKPKAKDQRTAA